MRFTFDSRSSTASTSTMPYLSVFLGLDGLHTEDAALARLEDARHLREARFLGVDEVVGEVHEKRLVADDGPRAQHGVAESRADTAAG